MAFAQLAYLLRIAHIHYAKGFVSAAHAQRQLASAPRQVFHMQATACRRVKQAFKHVVKYCRCRLRQLRQIGERLGKDVALAAVQQACVPAWQLFDVAHGSPAISHHIGQEQQDIHHIGHLLFVLGAHRRDLAAHEYPKRLGNVKRLVFILLLIKHAKLLVITQQTRCKVQAAPLTVSLATLLPLDVEDLIVLAKER